MPKPHIDKLLQATNNFSRECREAFRSEDMITEYKKALDNFKIALAGIGLGSHFEWPEEGR